MIGRVDRKTQGLNPDQVSEVTDHTSTNKYNNTQKNKQTNKKNNPKREGFRGGVDRSKETQQRGTPMLVPSYTMRCEANQKKRRTGKQTPKQRGKEIEHKRSVRDPQGERMASPCLVVPGMSPPAFEKNPNASCRYQRNQLIWIEQMPVLGTPFQSAFFFFSFFKWSNIPVNASVFATLTAHNAE